MAWLLCLPRDLFRGTSYSTVVLDRNGELLGARIADDGQWRFPPCDTVPEKYARALIQFEDRSFRYHPGVNPFSIARALWQNVRGGCVVSGGSTITMQVIRMSSNSRRLASGKKAAPRNVIQKLKESVLATRLELRCSKDEILALYASHAPFGGNVVGIDAASWRYFGTSAANLSWAEAATLAILPNSPALIHPGRNRELLLGKRNRLLKRLMSKGYISTDDYELSCEEPLPDAPVPLPRYASHLTDWYCSVSQGQTVVTDIDLSLQNRVEALASRWSDEFSFSGINDLCAVVVDVHTGHILAYVGNASPSRARPGRDVDILQAPRSTGSILKPFLYCSMLEDGSLLPNTLLVDTPLNINGFTPQNFNLQYDGAVPASDALARSLNVPAVNMLRTYGIPKFLDKLRGLGLTTMTREASDYGLSLILGGAEARPLEVTMAYARMSAWYQGEEWAQSFALEDRTAIWHTFEALKKVNRADQIDWKLISSVPKIAWKTGTSYGFRDAWAVGVTTDYAVGVWAGNAVGQGSPGLVGARTAGPVMFDIFNCLPSSRWFAEPRYGDYIWAPVCSVSGCLAGPDCEQCDTVMLPKTAMRSQSCPYHKMIDGESRFVLPPAMAWYYRQHHPEYRNSVSGGVQVMEFIYPESGSRISIPIQMDGSVSGVVFTLAHNDPSATVFWHLDGEYAGSTTYLHHKSFAPAPGPHVVTVVDNAGNTQSVSFEVL